MRSQPAPGVTPVQVGNVTVGGGDGLVFIAGPDVIEAPDVTLRIADKIRAVADRVGVRVIFKASYLKDNRSSASSYQGPGVDAGMEVMQRVKERTGLPVLSDVHGIHEVPRAAEVLDVIQIPAYLSMQTGLTLAVGRTGKPVNVKKGQFLHPLDMQNVLGKLALAGNRRVILTERGTCFGYRSLVVDIRSLVLLRSLGHPVVLDATHAVRNYGISSSDPAGGDPEFIPPIARAGVAAGCDAVFLETHDDLPHALCDAASMLPFAQFEPLVRDLQALDAVVRERLGRTDASGGA